MVVASGVACVCGCEGRVGCVFLGRLYAKGGWAWRVAGVVAVEEEWAAGCSGQVDRQYGVGRDDWRSVMMLSFMCLEGSAMLGGLAINDRYYNLSRYDLPGETPS